MRSCWLLLIRSWVASLYLRAPTAVLKIVGGLLLACVADLDVVNNGLRAGRLRHPRGRPLMLHDVGFPFPIGDAALHADRKSILADLRFRELRADRGLDLLIFLRTCPRRSGSLFGGRRCSCLAD